MRVDGFALRYWRSRKKRSEPSIFVDKPVQNLWMAVDKRCTKTKPPRTTILGGRMTWGLARALFADDAHLELGRDVRVQPDRDGHLTERLDRLVEMDAAPLDLDPVLAEEIGEILGRHRAEQLALFGGLTALLVGQ